jgi:hypothetical protein
MSRNNVIILIVVVSVLLLLSILFLQTNNRSFNITSTSPNQDETNVAIDGFIEINFSKNIEHLEIFSINDPSVDYSAYDVRIETRPTIVADITLEGGTFRIIPRHSLLESQEYALFLSNVTSSEGGVVDQYELTFTTGQDESVRAQFIRSLPLYQENYNVTYSSIRNAFIIQITGGDAEEATSNAYNLLRENGIDVDVEEIIVDTIRTEQGGGSPAG